MCVCRGARGRAKKRGGLRRREERGEWVIDEVEREDGEEKMER